MSALQERFDAAVKILKEHNTAAASSLNAHLVAIDDFLSHLRTMGGTSEDRLRKLSYEDILVALEKSLPSVCTVKPVPLARDIAACFRQDGDEQSDKKSEIKIGITSRVKVNQMSANQLVDAYDPNDANSRIGERLKTISQGKAFIVFLDNGTVATEISKKLLDEIRKGFDGRTMIEHDGKDRPVYRVGELPDQMVDEDPLYPGRPLRPDGTSDQTNRSWDGVPQEVRQLVRLVGSPVSMEHAHNIMDIAVSTDAMKVMRNRYKTASVEFNRLEKLGDLPKLKVALTQNKTTGGPFGQPMKVQFLNVRRPQ